MFVAALFGLMFGFFGSIPVAGPIAVLVFVRGVEGNFRSGVHIALGAAVAEGGYAFLAFWGFYAVLAQYDFVVPLSRAAAAVILIVLGAVLVRRKASAAPSEPTEERPGSSFLVGFSITALNPTLIATWSAAMTVLVSRVSLPPTAGVPFALGAIVGIVGWFGLLLWLLHRFRGRFRMRTLNRLVHGMGWGIVGIGAWFGFEFLRYAVERFA